jgi:hypothetical protein
MRWRVKNLDELTRPRPFRFPLRRFFGAPWFRAASRRRRRGRGRARRRPLGSSQPRADVTWRGPVWPSCSQFIPALDPYPGTERVRPVDDIFSCWWVAVRPAAGRRERRCWRWRARTPRVLRGAARRFPAPGPGQAAVAPPRRGAAPTTRFRPLAARAAWAPAGGRRPGVRTRGTRCDCSSRDRASGIPKLALAASSAARAPAIGHDADRDRRDGPWRFAVPAIVARRQAAWPPSPPPPRRRGRFPGALGARPGGAAAQRLAAQAAWAPGPRRGDRRPLQAIADPV